MWANSADSNHYSSIRNSNNSMQFRSTHGKQKGKEELPPLGGMGIVSYFFWKDKWFKITDLNWFMCMANDLFG